MYIEALGESFLRHEVNSNGGNVLVESFLWEQSTTRTAATAHPQLNLKWCKYRLNHYAFHIFQCALQHIQISEIFDS